MKIAVDKSVGQIRAALSWQAESSLDLDLSAFLLDDIGLARHESDFVFYNNPVSANGALLYSGDDRSGQVDGTNESIYADLRLIPEDVSKVVFCVTFDDDDVEHFFSEAGRIVLSVYGVSDRFDKGSEALCSVDIAAKSPTGNAMAVVELSRNGHSWEYEIVCEGADFGLTELCSRYGLEVD